MKRARHSVRHRLSRHDRRRRYYSLRASLLAPSLLLIVLAAAACSGSAVAQIDITVEPMMTSGPTDAPVTIVEFSDYQ